MGEAHPGWGSSEQTGGRGGGGDESPEGGAGTIGHRSVQCIPGYVRRPSALWGKRQSKGQKQTPKTETKYKHSWSLIERSVHVPPPAVLVTGPLP